MIYNMGFHIDIGKIKIFLQSFYNLLENEKDYEINCSKSLIGWFLF